MYNYEYERLKRIIDNAESVVFFGGAGVSTESGIPDFRGSHGIYSGDCGGISPEEILHRDYFLRHPEEFFDFYRSNMIHPYAAPNDAHFALARLEKEGKLSGIITQNIDGLHQLAGSENVVELHGTVNRNYCVNCGKRYPLSYVYDSFGVPRCTECGHIVRPDIVLYGEGIPADAYFDAQDLVDYADVLIVGGTSLRVSPASDFVRNFAGEHLIIINRDPTPLDGLAEYLFDGPVSEVLNYIVQ